MPLRRDALRFVDSSLDVKKGIVGKIKLKIPVSRLRSEPWSIEMEQVYVVVTPQRHEDYDELQDDAVLQEIKLSALDGIESEWRALHDVEHTASYYPSYSAWMSFGTSFIGTIIENLQVQIRDVHIRYEDNISIPMHPVACGFSLESLTAQSCDENWVPKFVFREQRDVMAFKLVELDNMSIYLNKDAEMFGDLPTEELLAKMSLHNSAGISEKNEYILNPVTASATIKRNCSEKPLTARKTPRVVCDLQLGNVQLDITDKQYQCAVTSARTLHQLHKNRAYWRWRPHDPVQGNTRAWWQYAITCHMEAIHDRHFSASWDSVLQKARDNVKYIQAFKKYLENPVVFDTDLREHKDAMDVSRSYSELKTLRDQAVLLLERELYPLSSSAAAAAIRTISETTQEGADEDIGDKDTVAQSTLQRWFPLWGGWYAANEDPQQHQQQPQEPPNANLNESSLEDEIMGALADEAANLVPFKDVIFMQTSFSLSKGITRLFSNTGATTKKRLLFEFEFTETKVEVETRPRAKSSKLNVSLGGIYVRDKITVDTVFPLLISPQNVQGAPLFPKKSGAGTSGSSGASGFTSSFAKTFQSYLSTSQPTASSEPLFYLLYEKRPFGSGASKIDYRLHLKSQPLNVVYNPAVVQCVGNFFKIPDELNRTAQLSQKIRNAAFTRIEEAKQKTKEELKKNLNSLFQESVSPQKAWDISLDLSAPQIIIPEHFVDKEALIMVLDFGKFHMESEASSLLKEKLAVAEKATAIATSAYYPGRVFLPGITAGEAADDEDDSDDEEFVTPDSSPTSPIIGKSDFGQKDLSSSCCASDLETAINKKIYQKFSVSLSDMQVIVGRVKDNWKHAHVKGTSTLHVLDKFSIALKCERRIVPSQDPNLPNVVISGTLPKLNVHVNEDKINILDRITQLIISDLDSDQTNTDMANKLIQTELGSCSHNILDDSFFEEDIGGGEDFFHQEWNDKKKSVDESSKLLLLYFCISDMSVELQSMGKSIVELQVTGVKSSLTKRPYDTNVTMSVHSLLLVDAMQTLGPNFELLVASHRSVMVDSISGSLRGSDPVSPISPSSPDPFSSNKLSTPIDIATALSSLQRQKVHSIQVCIFLIVVFLNVSFLQSPHMDRRSTASLVPLAVDIVDPDALISIDIMIISPKCPSMPKDGKERMQIVSIQFNSLDVIANQETIIELLSFGRRVMPDASAQNRRKSRRLATKEQSCQTEEAICRYPSLSSLDSLQPLSLQSIQESVGQK